MGPAGTLKFTQQRPGQFPPPK